jgi:hypothetical protein
MVQGRLMSLQLHLLEHGSSLRHPHLIILRTESGARAVFSGRLTGVSVFICRSFFQPNSSGLSSGGLLLSSDLHKIA